MIDAARGLQVTINPGERRYRKVAATDAADLPATPMCLGPSNPLGKYKWTADSRGGAWLSSSTSPGGFYPRAGNAYFRRIRPAARRPAPTSTNVAGSGTSPVLE